MMRVDPSLIGGGVGAAASKPRELGVNEHKIELSLAGDPAGTKPGCRSIQLELQDVQMSGLSIVVPCQPMTLVARPV